MGLCLTNRLAFTNSRQKQTHSLGETHGREGSREFSCTPSLEIIYNTQYNSVLPKSRLRYCKGKPIKSAVYCLNKHVIQEPFQSVWLCKQRFITTDMINYVLLVYLSFSAAFDLSMSSQELHTSTF